MWRGVLINGDGVDRLMSWYTSLILLLLSIITALLQVLGTPMRCNCPTQFSVMNCEYATTLCWNTRSYYTPFRNDLAQDRERSYSVIQLVPVILLLHALLLYFPSVPWRLISDWTELRVCALLETVRRGAWASPSEERRKAVEFVARAILNKRSTSSAVIPAFLITKFLYIITPIIQLALLDNTLAPLDRLFGPRILHNLVQNIDVQPPAALPASMICDFSLLGPAGSVQRYSISCFPQLRAVYELLLMLLWLWLLVLVIVAMVNLTLWVMRLMDQSGNVAYLRKLLLCAGHSHDHLTGLGLFYRSTLGTEGMLLLRLIVSNVGDADMSLILEEVWKGAEGIKGAPETKANIPAKFQQPKAPAPGQYPGTEREVYPVLENQGI